MAVGFSGAGWSGVNQEYHMSKSTDAQLQVNARHTRELLERLNAGIEALNEKLEQSVQLVEAAAQANSKPKQPAAVN